MEFAKGLMSKAPTFPRPLLWDAFWDLDTMRPWQVTGMDGRIIFGFLPLDKVRWYAERELKMDEEEAEVFSWIITKADRAYVSKRNKPK